MIYDSLTLLAVQNVFPKSKNLLCAWHVQQGFKKRFAFLNRGKEQQKKDLYNLIVSLPLSQTPENFDDNLKSILKNKFVSKEHKSYLQEKAKRAEKWAKCFMKSYFCCGMCTSSRIEAKHRLYKRFMNSSTQLTEFFNIIQELEEREITSFKDEINRFNRQENKKMEESALIKYFKDQYSNYALSKLKEELIESTNYKLLKKNGEKWYLLYFS